ncbi:MAG TPA: ribulose-phosphate 3-epimerase [Acidobacteriota bacterium]|nr:ribulose-phosphate 3-epimerase [Acidobacteriota bacterium]
MSGPLVAPSLLAADQTDVASAVRRLDEHCDVFHVDVMDGHFVPNISMGPAVVEGLRPRTSRPLDVHLMVADPGKWVELYRAAGADWISVHAEATEHLERIVSQVRESGARAGVALNPATSPNGLEYSLQDGDFVVVMTVNPGFGGQRFLPASVGKIAAIRRYLDDAGLGGVDIEVDGGIDSTNAGDCVRAGAKVLVAGSAIVSAADPVEAARAIRAAGASG